MLVATWFCTFITVVISMVFVFKKHRFVVFVIMSKVLIVDSSGIVVQLQQICHSNRKKASFLSELQLILLKEMTQSHPAARVPYQTECHLCECTQFYQQPIPWMENLTCPFFSQYFQEEILF